MKQPRLLLADDHAETVALLRSVLEAEFDVIADVPDGHALVSAAADLHPDVIVSDVSMPGLDGMAAATLILRHDPAARIVFVTVHDDLSLAEHGLGLGALGFVLKLAAGDELIPAVHAALRGERYLGRLRQCRTTITRTS